MAYGISKCDWSSDVCLSDLGRKDPMVGTTGTLVSGSTTVYAPKTTYGNKVYQVQSAGSGVPFNYGILNPNIFYSSQSSINDYRWSSNRNVN